MHNAGWFRGRQERRVPILQQLWRCANKLVMCACLWPD